MEALLTLGRERRARRRKQLARRLRISKAFTALGLAIFGFCFGGLGLYQWMAGRVADLAPAPLTASDKAALAPITFEDQPAFPAVDWAYWQAVNPAIVGWVTIPDTPIDYAIVMADAADPDYYLTHDIYHQYNIFGCPYVDAACQGLFTSPNTVIYGHHMANNAMFAAFSLYTDRAFAEAHPYVYVQSPTEKRVYEVQAADIINGEEAVKRTTFVNHDDFLAYYAERLAKSDFKRYDTASASSCITFCTCSYHFNPANERTLVFAKPLTINGAPVDAEGNLPS